MKKRIIDRPFLIITTILVLSGFFIFISASLGLLARDGANFSAVIVGQLVSIVLGLILMFFTSRIPYKFWNKYAFHIFLFSIFTTLLVFIPFFGSKYGTAQRWINIGGVSFQPAEFLKIAFVIYWSAWIAGVRTKIKTIKLGIAPIVVTLGVIGAILLNQPDTGTFLVIAITALVMFIAAGGRWTHIISIGAIGSVLLLIMGYIRPYLRARLMTFISPGVDLQGSGYQLKQSLISIGSGEIFGRGFGQSIQKFGFLPEPIGDSIFAVFSEEWGIVGALVLITLFLIFAFRGLRIANHAPTAFSRMMTVGIITLIITQSFMNIASILGVFPLTGMPLIFVSQGGSAMMLALASVGIIFNISKYQQKFV